MFSRITIFILLMLWHAVASAAIVSAKNGNIYYFGDDGAAKQLTTFGTDHSPNLSPDGRSVVFVRERSVTLDGPDRKKTSELWTMQVSGKSAKLLLNENPSNEPQKTLEGFSGPVFSLDGGSVYFMSSAWVTSHAIHIINLKTKKSRFVSDGGNMRIVPSGKYVGHLIAIKHKYFAGSGSYDFYWLVSPQGKEILPIGEGQEQIEAFLQLNE